MAGIFITGHRGMVGSAMVRAFTKKLSDDEYILAPRNDLDLLQNQSAVELSLSKMKSQILLLMRLLRLVVFMPTILIRLNSFIKTYSLIQI
jgi:nucleoside-diphosphate-sugar epimerase